MDRTVLILIIVLLIVFGIFLIMKSGSDSGASNSATGFASYAGQQYGGGCGR